MVISGHVRDNMIILDKEVRLPNGIKVIITIPDVFTGKSSGLCGIWEDSRSAEEIADELISLRSEGREISL